MSLSSQESVCQKFKQIRERINQLKESWDSGKPTHSKLGWESFHAEWHERWMRIKGTLREIDQLVGGSGKAMAWDKSQPAILQFPASE